ncbi:MAG: hypothetical protein RIQ97_476 [Pseudomonadota bacterium]|jgi:glutaredoxin-related protein
MQITSEKILLVEGVDDQAMFKKLIEKLEFSNIQIIIYEGKSQLKNYLNLLQKQNEFEKVTTIGITQDADNDPILALDRINCDLKSIDLDFPKSIDDMNYFQEKNGKRVGIFLLPSLNKPGSLEDLILESIKSNLANNQLIQLIEECIEKIKNSYPSDNCTGTNGIFGVSPRESKSKCLGIFMATWKPNKSIKEAIESSYINFDSNSWDELKKFIKLIYDN